MGSQLPGKAEEVHYLILQEWTADKLTAEVARFLDDGWIPHGSLAVAVMPRDADGNYAVRYIQAITKV